MVLMKRMFASFAFVLLLVALGAVAQAPAASPAVPPAAQDGPGGTRIGIVNIQAAIANTNEGLRDFGALEKKFEPKRTELEKNSKELEALKDQLKNQGDKLNESARADLVKNIEGKQKTLQRSYEDAQAEFGNQQNEIANRIGEKMVKILEDYATKNGYAMVLDVSAQSSPVLWASANTNITKPIVDAYNAQSNVPPPPAGATAPKAPTTGSTAKPAAGATEPKK